MTREEAIDNLKADIKYWENTSVSTDHLYMAIKALEQESSYNSVNSLVESKLKNPKTKTFDILHFVADNAGLSTFEAIEKAYNTGVSEQKLVLDKIRTEIIEKFGDCECDEERGFLYELLEVIDKYKGEMGDT
jgi:hypothetical protein